MVTIAEILLEKGEAHGLPKGREQGLAEGRAEGFADGKAEGRATGKVQGKAEALIHLLQRRFGPLSGEIHKRIAAAGEVQVEAWFDAAIDAPDPAAIFAPEASVMGKTLMYTRVRDNCADTVRWIPASGKDR